MAEPIDPSRESAPPAVSVVVPVKNESGNIRPLAEEIFAALGGRWPFEIVFVNDGSSDNTAAELAGLSGEKPQVRFLTHVASCGQSAAIRTGVAAARAPIVCTLDGDGQNDPKYLVDLIEKMLAAPAGVGLVAGQRVGRKASASKRWQSKIANAVRNGILRDGSRDTGCGLKCFRRNVFLALPYFDGLHRFLAALVRRDGHDVLFVDVIDRPRRHGVSNYGMLDRAFVGVMDLFGVWWLVRRRKNVPKVVEASRNAD